MSSKYTDWQFGDLRLHAIELEAENSRLKHERDEARREVEELWHTMTCPYDHCQRCCDQENLIKSIRDRMRADDAARTQSTPVAEPQEER